MSAAADLIRPHLVTDGGAALAAVYAGDVWRAADLGVTACRGRDKVWFEFLTPGLATKVDANGGAGSGSRPAPRSARSAPWPRRLARFSRFLHREHPEIVATAGITRPLLEDFLRG